MEKDSHIFYLEADKTMTLAYFQGISLKLVIKISGVPKELSSKSQEVWIFLFRWRSLFGVV